MHLGIFSHCFPIVFLGTTAVLSILITVAIAQPDKAQQSQERVNLTDEVVFHETFDPPGDDSPDRTSGIGSRSGWYNAEKQSVQALMPVNNFGLTLAEHPTIVVQVPENSAVQQLILTVMDENGLYYAEESVLLESQTGLISLSLSGQAPPLTAGSKYRWHVVVVSGEQADPDNPVLAGWIQRVNTTPLLTQLLQQKTPLEKAQWLAENGYWYDMLPVLMDEIKLHPDDLRLQAIWQSIIPS